MSGDQAVHKKVQASLDGVTADSAKNGVAGLVFTAVDRNGEVITANASGNMGLNTKKPMDLETVFWMASCTKLLATIACMQLVEQGKIGLDDHKQLYKVLPELEKMQVLQDDGSFVAKKKEITLRMLLSHTAGFGYEFFNQKLVNYGRPAGFNVFNGDIYDVLNMPLVNQPGSRWEYGTNIDWAGLALERISGLSLNDYLQKHILQPLELHNINMFPSKDMQSHLASMHQGWADGSFEERDHPMSRALIQQTDEDKKRFFNSGGAGCFARPTEYVQVLVALLNDGTHPKTKNQILKPETVKEMFENQIPDFPDFARNHPLPPTKREFSNPAEEIYPQEGNPPQGWGLSFMITHEPGVTGRGRNTAWWAGIANCFWWCDREKGVAGIITSQVLPFGNMDVLGQWFACETAVYDSLK